MRSPQAASIVDAHNNLLIFLKGSIQCISIAFFNSFIEINMELLPFLHHYNLFWKLLPT